MSTLTNADEFAIAVSELGNFEDSLDVMIEPYSGQQSDTSSLTNDSFVIIDPAIGYSLTLENSSKYQIEHRCRAYTPIKSKPSPVGSPNLDNNDSSLSSDPNIMHDLTKQSRILKNREAAIRSRQRRNQYVKSLEDSVKRLIVENHQLKTENDHFKSILSRLIDSRQSVGSFYDAIQTGQTAADSNGQAKKRRVGVVTILAVCSLFVVIDILNIGSSNQALLKPSRGDERVLSYVVDSKDLTKFTTDLTAVEKIQRQLAKWSTALERTSPTGTDLAMSFPLKIYSALQPRGSKNTAIQEYMGRRQDTNYLITFAESRIIPAKLTCDVPPKLTSFVILTPVRRQYAAGQEERRGIPNRTHFHNVPVLIIDSIIQTTNLTHWNLSSFE